MPASSDASARWDTAGPDAATGWLHPGAWTPGQDWGWFSGNAEAANIFGSWGGVRDDLQEKGISFSLSYTGQFAANPSGGEIPDGASWIGDWSLAAFVDFERAFGGPEGTYFVTSVNVETGTIGLTPANVGNLFPVQISSSADPFPQIALVDFALGGQLFDNTVEVVAGRIGTGDDFATLNSACTSLNAAICGNPVVAESTISFPAYPVAAWGARALLKPGDAWYAQAGAYLVYPDLGDPDLHGVEFGAPDGSGVLAIGEAGVNVGTRAGASGLPGTYKAGGYVDTERLTNLQTGLAQDETWGAYVMGEQMVYSADDSRSRGLWAWLALSYAPPDVNEIAFMAAGGLSYAGPFASRPDDTVSFVAAAGAFSKYLPDQDVEILLELNYQAQVLPAVYVRPDIQYIIDPDGKSSIDDALVIGFSVGATF